MVWVRIRLNRNQQLGSRPGERESGGGVGWGRVRFRLHFVKKEFDPFTNQRGRNESTAPSGAARSTWGKRKREQRRTHWQAKSTDLTARLSSSLSVWLGTGWGSSLVSHGAHVAWHGTPRFRSAREPILTVHPWDRVSCFDFLGLLAIIIFNCSFPAFVLTGGTSTWSIGSLLLFFFFLTF